MPQRKKDNYLYKSDSAKDVVDGEYILSEPQSFYEWSKLIDEEKATKKHHDEFDLRMMMHFADKVCQDEVPEKWVMIAIANAFTKIINGGRWEDEFELPWTEISLPWSPAETKDLNVFCEISNKARNSPSMEITKIIETVAIENSVSYEKARAAYYKFKSLTKA